MPSARQLGEKYSEMRPQVSKVRGTRECSAFRVFPGWTNIPIFLQRRLSENTWKALSSSHPMISKSADIFCPSYHGILPVDTLHPLMSERRIPASDLS